MSKSWHMYTAIIFVLYYGSIHIWQLNGKLFQYLSAMFISQLLSNWKEDEHWWYLLNLNSIYTSLYIYICLYVDSNTYVKLSVYQLIGVFCDRLKSGSTAALDCRTCQKNGRNSEKDRLFLLAKNFSHRGYSMTTWTQCCSFLTTNYLHVDIFNLEHGRKLAFLEQPTTSPCPRSHWMTPSHIYDKYKCLLYQLFPG